MMKSHIVASLLCTAAVAHADTSYVGAGVTLGGDSVGLYGAYTAEGGYRLSNALWAHGMIAKGGMAGVDEPTYASDYFALRGGIEARACVTPAFMCGIAGVDLAARHEVLMDEYDSGKRDGFAIVPRLGADIGGKHLRLRAMSELTATAQKWDGFALVGGLTYQW